MTLNPINFDHVLTTTYTKKNHRLKHNKVTTLRQYNAHFAFVHRFSAYSPQKGQGSPECFHLVIQSTWIGTRHLQGKECVSVNNACLQTIHVSSSGAVGSIE